MQMKTAVITTGGLGTRLLTYTKTNPKTMLPLYEKSKDKSQEPALRPLIEIIFENLYDKKIRRFCFIVGAKTKRSIIEHLTPDQGYIELLKRRNMPADRRFIKTLTRVYKKMEKCEIDWISQSTPMGFGHALLSAKNFVGKETFLLHAGDAYFPNYDFFDDLIKAHKFYKKNAATLLLQRKKILKGYGIAQMQNHDGKNLIIDVEEKPKKPKSNLAILPLYIFEPKIFDALKNTSRGHSGELQVTDAIKTLINLNESVIGFNYGTKRWYDIGSPDNYFKSLSYSYKKSK